MSRCFGSFALAAAVTACHAQNVTTAPYVSGLDSPISMVQDPAHRNLQMVIEQSGKIKVIKDGALQATPFLDLTTTVQFGGEQGLLGLAFAPDYATSGRFYVNMTVPGPRMQVARYQVSPLDPMVALPGSRQDVLGTNRVNGNHNGGSIAFGPDGLLYIGTGDGGGSGDQPNNAQTPGTWLGKMLRIDPATDDFPADPTRNYHVPTNNPFVAGGPPGVLKEIWAFGLRNPFKFSLDNPNLLGTGALLIGDVGQDDWEEVDYLPAGPGGKNLGWKRFEGFSLFSAPTALAFSPETKPAYVYNHTTGTTIIGGSSYRGLELGPDIFSRYFFADFSFQKLWSCTFAFDSALGRWKALGLIEHTATVGTLGQPVGIDADSFGELYVVDYGGSIRKLVRANTTWLKEFTVPVGHLVSGSTRNLVLNEGKTLQVETSKPSQPDMVISAFGRSNVTARNALDLDAVGSLTTGTTGLLRISLRRWSDNQLVQVSAQNMDSVVRRFRLTNLSATDFVRAGDGRIELRLYLHKPVQGTSRVLWDQVVFKVR